MKEKSLFKAGSSVIAIALASLAPISAHADFTILGNTVTEATPGISTAMMDTSQYNKLDILGNVQWIPKSRGAQGPMRSDNPDQDRMASEKKLDILGNVFWLPTTGVRY